MTAVMMLGVWMVTVLHAVAVATQSEGNCQFPESLHTGDARPDWSGHITEQNGVVGLRINVDKNTLQAVATNHRLTSYSLECLQQIENKYLVAKVVPGQDRQYMCIQFVWRSPNVIQFRVSNQSAILDAMLCDDGHLSLDDWLIVDRTAVVSDRQHCPLSGGYSVTVFDRSTRQGVCDTMTSHTRMESACVPGEGTSFYFRRQRCVPDGLMMFSSQPTLCAASWTEAGQTYVLLRHETYDKMWVLRYITNHGDSFIAYLIKDLVADVRRRIRHTNNYIQMDSVLDSVRPVTSLCVDDYEGCNYGNVCSPNHRDVMACPQKCGLCNTSRPAMCAMDTSLRGNWYDVTNNTTVLLTVNTTTFTVTDKSPETFHCVQWDLPSSNVDNYVTEKMFVTGFENGCRPKYSCAKFLRGHSGSVMFMKMSQSKLWPFTRSTDQPVDCSHFHYQSKDDAHLSNFKSHHYKMIRADSAVTSTHCNISRDFARFHATLRSGEQCTGSMDITSLGTRLAVNATNCSVVLQQEYECVDAFDNLSHGDKVVVTRTLSANPQFHCWLFPGSHRSKFYLLDAAHCHEKSRNEISNDPSLPLVAFSIQREVPVITVKPTTVIVGGNKPSDIKLPPTATVSYKYDRTTGMVTEEPPATSPGKYTSIIIVGIVLFVAVAKLSCWCKGS